MQPIKSRVKRLTATEAAWLAGFFDGEGSLSPYYGGRDKLYLCWKLSIPNTHRASILYCARITGIANVCEKKCKPNHKRQWQWQLSAIMEIKDLCRQMLPYLVTKKRAVEQFLGVR